MKLYKSAGVNPLGGCLPMLLQMPILLAFFYFFPSSFELRQESFLWVKDLATYDEFFKFGFEIPILGWDHLRLMCILMTVSTLIYTYINNQIRSEEHRSECQSLMLLSYAVFCLKTKKSTLLTIQIIYNI